MPSNHLILRLAEFLKSRQSMITADCATLVHEQSDAPGGQSGGFPWKGRLGVMLRSIADSLLAMAAGEPPAGAASGDHTDGVEIQHLFMEASLVRNAFARALNRFQAEQSGRTDFTALEMTEVRQDALDHFDNRIAAELSQWIAGRAASGQAPSCNAEVAEGISRVVETLEKSLRGPAAGRDEAITLAVMRLRRLAALAAGESPAPVVEAPTAASAQPRLAIPLQMHPLDVRAFTSHVARSFEPFAKQKGLGFEVRAEDGPAVVRTDAAKLHQVVSFLMHNILNSCRNGRVALIVGRGPANTWTLAIKTSGPSIPPDQLAAMLRGSFPPGNGGARPGGAVAVREIAEALGGALDTASEGGEGCCLTLLLPVGM